MKQQQQQFDFTRGDQLWLLDHSPLQLESVTEGTKKTRVVKVSAAAQRAVLRVIDGHDRGSGFSFPSDARIGKICNLSERTVRRAIKALEKRQILLLDGRPGQTRIFRINWGELSLRKTAGETPARRGPAAGDAPASGASATGEALENSSSAAGEALASESGAHDQRSTARTVELVSWSGANDQESTARTVREEIPPEAEAKKFWATSELVTGTSELVTGTSELSSDEPKETKNKRLRSEGATDSTDQKFTVRVVRVPVAVITQRVGTICTQLQYRGDDAGTLWTLAAAEHAGLLSEHDLSDAVNAAVKTRTVKRKVVGYVRETIRRNNGLDKAEMRELLEQVRVTPRLPRRPPERAVSQRQRVVGGNDGPSVHERRRAVLDALEGEA